MRYFIHLAYHGKPFHGWQRQPNALSVQEEIENKLSVLLKEETEITGCGRTDTGVHAAQYYAHFNSMVVFDPKQLAYKLNAILPKEISVYDVFAVHDTLHARFDAALREYEYHIHTRPNPFVNDLQWIYTHPLNVERMNEAAALLLSYTDFECFSKVHTDVKTFNCKLSYARWEWKDEYHLVFTIAADRFLRNMVRAVVGTLINVGKGKTSLEEVKTILESRNRSEAGESVPAHGLYLTKVLYPQLNS